MRIELFISEENITKINDYSLDIMSIEDIIYWLFPSEIKILTQAENHLFITEFCLFQFLEGLTQAIKEIKINDKTQVVMDNMDSGDAICIEKYKETIVIKYTDSTLEICCDEFLIESKRFIVSTIQKVKELFPKLSLNLEFNAKIQTWLNDVKN
jgi:hypothetical protein